MYVILSCLESCMLAEAFAQIWSLFHPVPVVSGRRAWASKLSRSVLGSFGNWAHEEAALVAQIPMIMANIVELEMSSHGEKSSFNLEWVAGKRQTALSFECCLALFTRLQKWNSPCNALQCDSCGSAAFLPCCRQATRSVQGRQQFRTLACGRSEPETP